VKDALGRSVTFSRPPHRLISLSPATSENLFAIGAGKYLVGRTTACDYPMECQKIPSVGDFYRPTIERILTLKPDLIVFDSNTITINDADALQKRLKTPVYVFQTRRYDDITKQLSILASWFSEKSIQEKTKKQIEALSVAKLQAIACAKKQQDKPNTSNLTAFIEINETPLYGAGNAAFVADILPLLGLKNSVLGATAYPQISREQLFTFNPDIYIIAQSSGVTEKRKFSSPLDKIKAVQAGRVYAIPNDHLLRPTPRLALGLTTLAKLL
jgi:iron complex transport system substrate-binding protein